MTLLAHVTTGVASAATAIAIIFFWPHTHPAAPLAKVDIIGIVSSQQKNLAAQLKPGMNEQAQAALIAEATRFGKRLDAALLQVVSECKCTLINSAAIIRDAPSGTIRDYSERIADLARSKK